MSKAAVERRRSARYLCSHLVEIHHGGLVWPALLEDLSAGGAALALEAPIGAGETIQLTALGLLVPAQVRYCRKRENDFLIGVQFSGDFRWRAADWQPDHIYIPGEKK